MRVWNEGQQAVRCNGVLGYKDGSIVAVVMTEWWFKVEQRCNSMCVMAGNSGGWLSSLETLLPPL